MAAMGNGMGVAVGRPENPDTPLGQQMRRYADSTRLACTHCRRPTWYGPRLMEKIAEGACASCGDCAFLALAMGVRPSAIVHLGGRAIDG